MNSIELPVTSNKDIVKMNSFYLLHYYLLVTINSKLYIYQSLFTSPLCEDKHRIKSFYLPTPPLYNTNTISSNSINNNGNTNNNYYGSAFFANLFVNYDIERDGIFHLKEFYIILFVFILLYLLINPIIKLETKINNKYGKLFEIINKYGKYIVILGIIGIFLFSMIEIIYQNAFVNDWPAHLHHVEQYYIENTTNYNELMHYHGPCTYPAGFMYLYTPLYLLSNSSLQLFQVIWALLESLQYIVIYKIIRKVDLPIYLSILPILSNRLHLYNVRVVINDFPVVFLMFLTVYMILNKRYTLASLLYSFVLSNKLNFIFYSPAILVVYLGNLGIKSTILQLIIMGISHLLIALPFLIKEPIAYLSNAYDIGRTLLWEKTRAFKFVGRLVYDNKLFHIGLLAIIALLLFIYVIRSLYGHFVKIKYSKYQQEELIVNRLNVHVLFFINYLFVSFARGLYTPFMCWYFYSFPLLWYVFLFFYFLLMIYYLVTMLEFHIVT